MTDGGPDEFGPNDTVQRSEDLDAKIERSPIDFDALVTAGAHRQQLIRRLTVGLVVLFWVVVVVAVLSYQLSRTVDRLDRTVQQSAVNSQSVHASCEAGNEFRQDNLRLWEGIIQLPPSPPIDPGREERLAQLRVLLDEVFKPRDCDEAAPVVVVVVVVP